MVVVDMSPVDVVDVSPSMVVVVISIEVVVVESIINSFFDFVKNNYGVLFFFFVCV